LWNGKYPQAQEVLNRLQRDFPADREVLLLLAQSYLWSKDYTNALTRFSDLVAAGPDMVLVKGGPETPEPLAVPDIWRGYIDAAAGAVGESLREQPRKNVGPLFSSAQRDAIFRAYQFMTTVRDKTVADNKTEMERLNAPGTEKDPTFGTRQQAQQAKNDTRMKSLAGSMGRLGLLLGLLGDRDKSGSAFGAALAIDRQNREVWLQYAQTLTALGDDLKAKTVFDWLLSNPAEKAAPPSEPREK